MAEVDGGAYDESANIESASESTAVPAAAMATGGSEAFQALMGGDRSLAILFGSQTGNAAGLADKTAKLAADYGLVPTICLLYTSPSPRD